MSKVCRKMGISEQTYYRWKNKFQGMGVADVRWLRGPGGGEPPAQASGRRPLPGQADAPGRAAINALKPAQLRPRADYLQVAYRVSERGVCKVLAIPWGSYRYRSAADEQSALRIRIRDLARAQCQRRRRNDPRSPMVS